MSVKSKCSSLALGVAFVMIASAGVAGAVEAVSGKPHSPFPITKVAPTPTPKALTRTTTYQTPAFYASRMGQRDVDAAGFMGKAGWGWTERGLASLNGGKSSNAYFTYSNGRLVIRPGVKPSEALKHVFYNNAEYGFDCASGAALVLQAGRLLTLGDDDFNRLYPNNTFAIYGWSDTSNTRFSTVSTARTFTTNGQMTINGKRVLAGELMPFDPNKGDSLIVGAVYYFEMPGNNSDASQGWNAVYLGQANDGRQAFFRSPGGVAYVTLDPKNNYSDTSGPFVGGYLSSSITRPDGNRLYSQDWDGVTNW